MKIRTDFVTNSSSSSYVTINIKNPKLAELIRAAKRSHPARERDIDTWEKIDIDESEQTVKMEVWANYYDIKDKLDAGLPPERLDDLPGRLSRLLENISEYRFPDYDLEALRSALKENGQDVAAGTESVDWTYDVEGYGESALYRWYWDLVNMIVEKENLDYKPSSVGGCISFHYDRENGESHEEDFSYNKPYSSSADDGFWDDDVSFDDFKEGLYDEDILFDFDEDDELDFGDDEDGNLKDFKEEE